jgi:hypothetical protein
MDLDEQPDFEMFGSNKIENGADVEESDESDVFMVQCELCLVWRNCGEIYRPEKKLAWKCQFHPENITCETALREGDVEDTNERKKKKRKTGKDSSKSEIDRIYSAVIPFASKYKLQKNISWEYNDWKDQLQNEACFYNFVKEQAEDLSYLTFRKFKSVIPYVAAYLEHRDKMSKAAGRIKKYLNSVFTNDNVNGDKVI